MAKKARSSRSAAAKPTQRKPKQHAKPRQSAKSGARKTKAKATTAAPRSTKKKTATKKATPRKAGKTTTPAKRGAGRSTKARTAAKSETSKTTRTPRRATSTRSTKSRTTRCRTAGKPGKAQQAGAALDAWCEDCAAALHKLVGTTATKARGRGSRKKTRPSARQEAARRWVGSTVRQLGLGVRQGAKMANPRKILAGTGEKIRHIKFNDVSDFCKKEWKELASLASKIDALASNRPSTRGKRTTTKRTKK